MKTRITVIIPVYNVQEFLEDCVDSILNQTINKYELTEGYERNIQIILMDDGSTDDSAIIAKEYANKYDNIEYVYEENQGLGHARNHSCEYAEGDYITFVDSDDIIPPRAYERMYDLAIKNNSDLTIGNVWRFNSKSTWDSEIHRLAFSSNKEVTHITKNLELIYDTISCNKLIKFDFWKKHDFKFPEGILYEDIPVTIPMYFLANNVSIVHETCYLWRVREGLSKSITQTTNDSKNLHDRLYVMSLVDKFFKENISDDKLILAKNVKWLKIDLMIFVNKLKSASIDESKEIIEVLCDYINNNINLENLKHLNEIDQLKYKYLLNNEYSKLINLLNFEHEDLSDSEVFLKDGSLTIECDEDFCDKGYLVVDDYIKSLDKKSFLTDVSFKKKNLEITGFVVQPGLKMESFNDRELSFVLFNSKTHKEIPLKYEDVKVKNIHQFKIPFGMNIPYEYAGFKVYVPYSEIRDNEELSGENRIIITFKQDEIYHNFCAGAAKNNVRNKSDMKAIMRGDNYFCTKYDLNHSLILDIHPVKHRYEEISVENDRFNIHTPEFYGDIFIDYAGDDFHKEHRIPFVYDEKNHRYSVEIEKLPNLEGQIKYENGDPLVHKWKKFFFFNSNQGQCIINTLNDYHYDMTKFDDLTNILDISEHGSNIDISSKLYSTHVDWSKLNSVTLFFKDNKNHNVYLISKGTILDENEVKFKFNITDMNITKNLYQGFFDLLVEYEFDNYSLSTPLYMLQPFNHEFSDKTYDYSIYRSGKRTLRIKSNRKWPAREDTRAKRLKIAEDKYRNFRRLPINNKRIMFESMWGAKYSCNPRYLYEYIDKNHPEYECIWSFKDEHIPIKGNGIRVRRNSLKYFYYLATSKFFVNNVNFANHYVKRDGQIEIQTMHGTPLKTLGLDVPSEFKSQKQREDYIAKCSRWDYLTVQNDYVADVSKGCYAYKKEFLNFGYPRTDMLYNKNNQEDIDKLKVKIGLPLDKKIILYAPTWREKNKFDLMLDLRSLKKSLSDEYILILRLHHLSFKDWTSPKNDDFVYDLSRYDSIEELYLVSDLLVTDYSSVMFDYANLDRPMILFTYDLDEYGEKLRGFYIDIIENRPGPLVFTSKELEEAIHNIDELEKEYKPIRQKFRAKFNQYESGDSSEKIFNEVMLKHEVKDSILNKIEKIISKLFN